MSETAEHVGELILADKAGAAARHIDKVMAVLTWH